jgi:hypothetical protein
MGYTTTLDVIDHTLHVHVDRFLQIEDVVRQIMKNNLQRAMQEWLCTSKAEMTREAKARSWDETMVNVWHRLVACDHLLDIESWKHGEPPPGTGYLLRDYYQTPTNSKETHRGDHGHLGPIPRSTTNLDRHLERTMTSRKNNSTTPGTNKAFLPTIDSSPIHILEGLLSYSTDLLHQWAAVTTSPRASLSPVRR